MLSSSDSPNAKRDLVTAKSKSKRTDRYDPAADARLLTEVASATDEAVRRSGAHLVCRAGCAECCHGPFPISALDAKRLAHGLEQLAVSDPAAARDIAATAARQAAQFRTELGRNTLGREIEEEEALEALIERQSELPCPVLDPATLTCRLYAFRPIACRTFGPPIEIGGEPLPPCRLCFVGANEAEIERCRVEVDPRDLEGEILDTLVDYDRETLIAFVLAGVRLPDA